MSRFAEYLLTRDVDSRRLFARGAVLVFGTQAGYIAVLMIVTLVEPWAVHAFPGLTMEHGVARFLWFAMMFTLTVGAMVAQVFGLKLLANAVRPWTSHSVPALASILFALVGFVVLLGVFALLISAATVPGARMVGG